MHWLWYMLILQQHVSPLNKIFYILWQVVWPVYIIDGMQWVGQRILYPTDTTTYTVRSLSVLHLFTIYISASASTMAFPLKAFTASLLNSFHISTCFYLQADLPKFSSSSLTSTLLFQLSSSCLSQRVVHSISWTTTINSFSHLS